MESEIGRAFIPPSLNTKDKREILPPILQRLGISKRALDWKLIVRDLETIEMKYPEAMQEVLDFVSPVKSPIKEITDASISSDVVVNEDYSFLQSEKILGEGISKILGEGISKVKLAKHSKTGKLVAVKVFEKKQLGQPNPKQLGQHSNILREIMVLGGLYHPHINPILQVIDSIDIVYMIVKLEKGGDLFTYIKKNEKLSESESISIFRQILSAIHFLHSQGIIHRDIKPENILMDENHTHIKLCDFGFSSVYDPNRPFEDFCGSPEYAAPEMIGRKPYSGPEVDIWSLGVLLFVMLTGCLPFSELNKSKLYLAIMTAKFIVPPFISQSASSLIKSILVPQVSKRYSLAEIFSHPFISSNPAPILIAPLNTIPPIHPEIKSTLLELGYSEIDIHEYEITGNIGPVKAAVYLLEENFAPRLSKTFQIESRKRNHQNSETSYKPSKYTKTENGYVKISPLHTGLASEKTPLAGIKLSFQENQEMDSQDYMDTDENTLLKQNPPIITSFQHQTKRQSIHSALLQKIIQLKGRIPELNEEDSDTMVFELPVKKKHTDAINNLFTISTEADDGMDVDPEIQACFQESQESEETAIKVLVTTSIVSNGDPQNWCTVFKLVQFDPSQTWILEQFDDICLFLMKDASNWSVYSSW